MFYVCCFWCFSLLVAFFIPLVDFICELILLWWAFLLAQSVKSLPAMQETWAPSLGWEDSLEEGMDTHASILDKRIPMDRRAWQAIVHGVERVRHDWANKHSTYYFDVLMYHFLRHLFIGLFCLILPEYWGVYCKTYLFFPTFTSIANFWLSMTSLILSSMRSYFSAWLDQGWYNLVSYCPL